MEILRQLLIEQLQDVLHAETQLVAALPKMAKAAHDTELKRAFEKHLEQTEQQVERLKKVFERLEAKSKTKICAGMRGLVEEGQEAISTYEDKDIIAADLALIIAAQKVEHYEIAAYGSVRTLAEQLGNSEVVHLLEQTLGEEEQTDKLLTKLSKPLLENLKVEPPKQKTLKSSGS